MSRKPKLLFKAPVGTASGYGVHARQLLGGLLEDGDFDVSVRGLSWGHTSFLHSENMETIRQLSLKHEAEAQAGTKYDISVQVTIPNEFEKLADFNVGVTAGIEVDRVSPVWLQKANEMDLLVVPSTHSMQGFTNTAYHAPDGHVLRLDKVPVVVVPEGFDPTLFNTSKAEPLVDLVPDFNFLFVGLGLNHKMGEDRKNVSHLVKWFCDVFKGRADVGLVLKVGLVNNSLADLEVAKRRVLEIKSMVGCGELPRIKVVHGRLSDEELSALYRHPKIKAFVSLTHGEGFGLPLLEAAACGLPVLTTDWSGHLDFLRHGDEKTFVPIDHELREIPDSAVWDGVMERGSHWAYPKEADAKLKMRKMVAGPEKPMEWAANLARIVHEKFTIPTVTSAFAGVVKDAYVAFRSRRPKDRASAIEVLKKRFTGDRPSLLYTMPMSAGDVFMSTSIVGSLRHKFPGHKIYFATDPKYFSIVKPCEWIDEVIQWEEWMGDVPFTERVFDEVYTPNLGIQMRFSNWVHGGKGRNILDEMAVHCDVKPGPFWNIAASGNGVSAPDVTLPGSEYAVVHTGAGKGQWAARNYLHWQEVVDNITTLTSMKVVQVGTPDEPALNGCVNMLGKTADYRELAYVVSEATLFVGIDSVAMHMAAAMEVPVVALFGSSYPTSTGPRAATPLPVLLETPDRYTCKKACYQYTCEVDPDHPCINEVTPRTVVESVLLSLNSGLGPKMAEYKEHRPAISGYTHVFNAETGGYPYVESITSMLGFCDEVVVVDGGSDDGTVEKVKAIGDPRIRVLTRKWDWKEPGMDGMQKAFGRAMCKGEFLWQMDCDEVVHEDDYEKVRKLVKRFPKDVDILDLPVIELWGDAKHARCGRHAWKWRLSRNNFRITHGINKHARLMDEKTGKVYAKRGMSDGCEYVDIMTHEYVPHRNFWSEEIERLRLTDPEAYGERMNSIFESMPSVWHLSWCDLSRKVRNFKQFWNRSWGCLYGQETPEDRFPTVTGPDDAEGIQQVVEVLREQGDEHQKAPLFLVRRDPPKAIEGWLP